jgi:hypothetical protein
MDKYERHQLKLAAIESLLTKHNASLDDIRFFSYQYCLMEGNFKEWLEYLDGALRNDQ